MIKNLTLAGAALVASAVSAAASDQCDPAVYNPLPDFCSVPELNPMTGVAAAAVVLAVVALVWERRRRAA